MNPTKNAKATIANDQLSMEWETFEQFFADIAQASKAGQRMNVNPHNAVEWYGTCGGADGVMRRVRDGWPELRAKLEELTRDIELELPNVPARAMLRRRKRHRSDHGDTLDMTRVWGGELDRAWERPVREDVHTVTTKRVTVALDLGTPWHMTQTDTLWRAALALLLCDRLARAGKVFEVWVTGTAQDIWHVAPTGTNNTMTAAWCVKRTQDPLVLDRLCSMVTAGFWRACGFWSFHTVLDAKVASRYGYYPGNHEKLPASLQARRDAGECVLHARACLSKRAMLAEYARSWEEVEQLAEQAVA